MITGTASSGVAKQQATPMISPFPDLIPKVLIYY